MQTRQLRIAPGYLGATIITLGALFAAWGYVGGMGQSYSPINHFVSELGHTELSEQASAFNLALSVGGLFYGVFMMGVGLRFRGLMRWAFAIGGLMVGVFGALVGLFPMNVNLPVHGRVALTFFEGSLALLVLFSLYVGFSRQTAYPRWMALVALPMIVCNAIFVFLVLTGGEHALAAPTGGRPAFWLLPATEWGTIIFLLVWVCVVASYHLAHPRGATEG